MDGRTIEGYVAVTKKNYPMWWSARNEPEAVMKAVRINSVENDFEANDHSWEGIQERYGYRIAQYTAHIHEDSR